MFIPPVIKLNDCLVGATCQETEDGIHILMGIKNIDALVQVKISHANQVTSMQQKDCNHLEAILSSAAAYLEANLSQNLVLEWSIGHQDELHKKIKSLPPISDIPSYDYMQTWIAEHLVAANKNRYLEISSRQFLMDCFEKGEKRTSVSFSLYTVSNNIQPCKALFHLYQEKATGDLMVFCVIYDLTEQQKKEKELKELEKELNMCRIRNSTSQMKPHFLYNALGSIQEIVLTDPQYASDLLGDFMIHLRCCIRAMSNDMPIPFSEELKNIHAYVNIEKMRLGKKLNMQYDIKTKDFSILPLCIQPLVENAIRHGVHKRGRNGGKVILRTRSEDNAWVIQVEDTGIGFDVKQVFQEINNGERDSAGLNNIRFRLEKVMGGSMEIQSSQGVGTRVTVRIPKEEKNESNNC